MDKDRVEIMFEKMQGDIKLILEVYDSLKKEMNDGFQNVDAQLKEMKFDIKTLNTTVNVINYDLKELNEKFERHISLPAQLAHVSV